MDLKKLTGPNLAVNVTFTVKVAIAAKMTFTGINFITDLAELSYSCVLRPSHGSASYAGGDRLYSAQK